MDAVKIVAIKIRFCASGFPHQTDVDDDVIHYDPA